MGKVTDKTRAIAREQAWRLHGALLGLVVQLEANGLDLYAADVKKAVKAVAKIASEVQAKKDESARKKAEYHASVQAPLVDTSEVDALRREIAELRAQVGR